MSLVSMAARIIFTRLVRGQTLAGENVINAPLEPLDQVARAQSPVIAVYTGLIKNKNPPGRDLFTAERELRVELVFQTYLPPADTDADGVSNFNLQRAGAGVLMDHMQRQIITALQSQTTVWADLWKVLVAGYDDFDSRPVLIEVEGGVRIPCREVSLTCRTISDPKVGAPLSGFWLGLDGAMRDDPDLVPIADLIKGDIEGPAGMSDWHVTMAALGWTKAAMLATGLAPEDTTTDDDAALLTGAEIDPADLVVVAESGESFGAP
jgi:hypothetical protein